MNQSTIVDSFIKLQTKAKRVGLFLDIFEDKFVIGKKRYAADATKVINTSFAANSECPIFLVDNLSEVYGFIKGFCFASNKKFNL